MSSTNNPGQNPISPQEAAQNFQELKRIANQLGKDMNGMNISGLVSDSDKVLNLLKLWREELSQINEGLWDSVNSFNSLVTEISHGNIGLRKSESIYKSLTGIAEKLLNHEIGRSNLSIKDISKLKEKAEIEKTSLTLANSMLEAKRKELENDISSKAYNSKAARDIAKKILEIQKVHAQNQKIISNTDEAYSKLLEKFKNAESITKEYNKNLLLGSASLNAIEGILNRIGLRSLSLSLGFDSAKKAMDEKSQELSRDASTGEALKSNLSNKFKVLSEGIRSLNFNAGIISMGAILLNTIISIDSRVGNIAKNMNLSYNEALKMDKYFARMSFNSGNVFVNTKGLVESYSSINSYLGTNATLSEEHLKTFTKLREQAGFTNEELIGMSLISLSNNKTLADNTDQFIRQSDLISGTLGVSLNSKEIMKDISKISAATTLSLGKNPKLIAEAVTTAKALGMEMSKIEGMMNNILDFESSIENELQAELLIGRNINLETARWAALNNDVATFAKEINNQIGSSADFANMNRIQQEAIAKSVGMSREELGETLFVQEQLAGISGQDAAHKKELFEKLVKEIGHEEAKKRVREEGLDKLLSQASIQDELNKGIESMKESLLGVGHALIPIFDMFSGIVGFLAKNKVLLGAMVGIIGTLTVAMTALAAISAAKAMADILSMSALTFGLGAVGVLAGAALVGGSMMGMMSDAKQSVKDGIAPSSKGPFTITDKFGATAVTAEGDHMVVSPNVSRSNQTLTQPQPQQSTTQTIDMRDTNRLLEKLLQKQGDVRIDSTQMGTAIGMNTYSIQ